MIRQQLIEQLTREIMNYDAEYRREDAAGGIGVSRTALDLGRGAFRAAEATSRARLDRGVRLCFACQCFRVARQEAVTPRRARPHPQAGQAGRFSAIRQPLHAPVQTLVVIDELRPSICPTVFRLNYLIGMS